MTHLTTMEACERIFEDIDELVLSIEIASRFGFDLDLPSLRTVVSYFRSNASNSQFSGCSLFTPPNLFEDCSPTQLTNLVAVANGVENLLLHLDLFQSKHRTFNSMKQLIETVKTNKLK
jgi:hypothetical protein